MKNVSANPKVKNSRRPQDLSTNAQQKVVKSERQRDGVVLFDNLEGEVLLTATQLAIKLNVAVKTIRKWRYENVLPADSMVKLRHQVRYKWGKVLGWLQEKEV